MNGDSHNSSEGKQVPDSPDQALSRFRKPLVAYLVSGLEDNDKVVRLLAADMLGYVGDSDTARYLVPLLVDHDPDLRRVSAQTLELIDANRTVPGRARSDPCSGCMIRYIAEEALAQGRRG